MYLCGWMDGGGNVALEQTWCSNFFNIVLCWRRYISLTHSLSLARARFTSLPLLSLSPLPLFSLPLLSLSCPLLDVRCSSEGAGGSIGDDLSHMGLPYVLLQRHRARLIHTVVRVFERERHLSHHVPGTFKTDLLNLYDLTLRALNLHRFVHDEQKQQVAVTVQAPPSRLG